MAAALAPVSTGFARGGSSAFAAERCSRFSVVGRGYVSLRGRNAFSHAYRRGKRVSSAAVTTIVSTGEPGPARVGVVAGKRVGGAVQRNRAKRRLREAVARCTLQRDTVYLLVAEPAVLSVDFEQLVAALTVAVDAGVSGKEDE